MFRATDVDRPLWALTLCSPDRLLESRRHVLTFDEGEALFIGSEDLRTHHDTVAVALACI